MSGDHGHRSSTRPLAAALGVTSAFFILELAGGFWAHSLALMADAAHMAVDMAALTLSLVAAWIASLPPDPKRTYGYHRAEVLAALANGLGLWVAVGVILREAWLRIQAPAPVRVPQMLVIAFAGLLCNAATGFMLSRSGKGDLNVRSALVHVLSDLLGSVGAIAAGVAMWLTGSTLPDPLASVFICAVICVASFQLVREAVHILLEGTPSHLDPDAVRAALSALPGVRDVHDLHLWSLSSGKDAMSGHLVMAAGSDSQALLKGAQALLKERFGITHATLQIEAD
ncbi:MAG TPA: cation diffusion facilitator family transporter [Elusimicrobiota bacterium]|nr:cation diffusion facilitator family transporter [Elusimicrobiota bacterium]